jgi:diketogulonate reductase-like aldo/keto reductase
MKDPKLIAVARSMEDVRRPCSVVAPTRLCRYPQSAHPERIEENADVFDFELAPADMAALDNLHDGFRATGLDPSLAP